MDPESLVEFQTIKPDPLKKLFESLKEVIVDVNLVFDTDGLKIYAMNNHKTALVYFKIDKGSLEHYYVKERFLAGINIMSFYKQIKSGETDDILFINIDQNLSDTMNIKYTSETHSSIAKYRLMNVEEEEFNNIKHRYPSYLTIRASNLQHYIKDLAQISKFIEIKNIGSELVFATASTNEFEDFITKEYTVNVETTKIGDSEIPDILQGVFDIDLMVRFVKSTTINPSGLVKIYLANDAPLILEYEISSLGVLKFLIFQKTQE